MTLLSGVTNVHDTITKNNFVFPLTDKLLKHARGIEQQPLLSKVRCEGAFKNLENIKTSDENKPRYNLICIGSTRDSKNRVVLSENAQIEQTWATTTLNSAPAEVQKRMKQVATQQPRHKRMLTMSSKHFMFECQSQIKRQIKIFDDSSCSEQTVSSMPNHQIRFDDGIFFLLSLITVVFNHISQLDAKQLVNIFLPYSKNPDVELGIQPARAHLSTMLNPLRFIFAMSKQVNNIMKDANEVLGHMDVCQGRALSEVISNYDTNTRKGSNELYKLLFDKKNRCIRGDIRGHEKIRNSFPKRKQNFQKWY